MIKKILYVLCIVSLGLFERLRMFQATYKEDSDINSSYTIILFFVLLCCLFSCLRDVFRKSSGIAKYLIVLLSLMFIYSCIDSFVLVIIPLLFFVYMYSLFRNNDYSSLFAKSTVLLFFFLIGVYLEIFVDLYRTLNVTSSLNIAYFPLILLPCILCSNINRIIKILSVIVACVVVFSAMKRGGLIALALGLFAYYFVDMILLNNKSKTTAILLLFFIGIVFIIGFVKIDTLMGGSFIERMENLSSDQGSGRTTIYSYTIKMFLDSNVFTTMLGHGYNAVEQDSFLGFSAHNDYIEFLYDYGLILFIVYVGFNIIVFAYVIRLIRDKSPYAAPMSMSMAIYLVFTMISHVFMYGYFLFFLLFWAYVWGTIERERTNVIKISK